MINISQVVAKCIELVSEILELNILCVQNSNIMANDCDPHVELMVVRF